jgi:hypothetical protein
MLRRREIALVFIGATRGVGKGAMIGAALSVATGAAVVVSLPGSIPAVGGAIVVKAGTVATWSGVGSVVGAVAGGAVAYLRKRRDDAETSALLDELGLCASG